MSIPRQVPVKVVTSGSQARLISDPMRREILRLLSRRTYTAKELSDVIGLTPPSIGHHLKALVRGELISIVREEVGRHGIVQKWYQANAQAFVVDRERLPMDVRRYFMPIDIERARGVAACISVLGNKVTPSTSYLENLARQICSSICSTAQKYSGPSREEDPERTVHQLYVEALRQVIKRDPWIREP